MNPASDTGRTSIDIGGDANLELVDKFCYLGNVLSVDGDADADGLSSMQHTTHTTVVKSPSHHQ